MSTAPKWLTAAKRRVAETKRIAVGSDVHLLEMAAADFEKVLEALSPHKLTLEEATRANPLLAELKFEPAPLGQMTYEPAPVECPRCKNTAVEACNAVGCFRLEAGLLEPDAPFSDIVAWRCKYFEGGWILFHTKAEAERYRDETGCLMQALRVC